MIQYFSSQGGGASLNYSIVGSTQQPAGKENRIWINTSVAIGNVTIAYNAPATAAEGDVWIKTDNYSNLPLNISKKDTIIIMPVSVRLYTNGAWTDVTVDTKVYTSGSWMELLFIYWQYGTQYADKFMYNTAAFTVADQSATSTLKFTTTLRYENSKPVYFNAAIYFGPIDVTRFNKMTLTGGTKADTTETNKTTFGITKLYDSSSIPDEPSANPEQSGNDLASMTIPKSSIPNSSGPVIADHELDISSVTGEHYCYIKVRGYPNSQNAVEFSKIRFE